jgi:phosphoenolpyruvate carboxykinase (ATP)
VRPRRSEVPNVTATRPTPTSIGRSVTANLSIRRALRACDRAGEGVIAAEGPLVVRTGKHTGRSPQDKFIVQEPTSQDKIWWGDVNHPISEEHYDRLRARLVEYLADKDLYSQDMYIGAHEKHRRSLRVYTETAWASIFARNLFRRPPREDLENFLPNFTILDVPSFQADPATEGTRTGTAILLHVERMEIIIVGTMYAGEIKKSAFTVMNYLMPDEGVLPMHSSINVGEQGDACIFFGLSGTGKTTLSADPLRSLIGDDEHGWGEEYTFNFEGGCYAKTIRLSPMYEPDIFATTKKFGTILENVDIHPETRELDLDSERFTENTRAAYPLHYIGNADPHGVGPGPKNVVFLTADAFGVLPPISKLTREQAAYHFISGYTAKLAGTEIGVKEPKATFSAGFGAPFLPRHPGEYAAMLVRAARALRRPGLAREHRLDRRPLRRRQPDEHHPHPEHGPRGHQRPARRCPDVRRPDLPGRGPDAGTRRPGRGPRPPQHLGGQGRVRPAGPPSSRRCSTRTSSTTPRRADAIKGPGRSTSADVDRRPFKLSKPGEG